jgi:integrase
MSLKHRCECPEKQTRDCEHPWWMKFKYEGVLIQESTEQTSQQKARLVERKRKGDLIDQGTGIAKRTVVRLKAHIADYLEWARSAHPATAEEKDARILPTFLAIVGDKPLDKVSTFDIERWRQARLKTKIRAGRTVSRQTVNRDFNIIRGLFRQAVAWKRLTGSPAKVRKKGEVEGIDCWKTDETPIRVLTAAERAIVLTQLQPRVFSTYCEVTLEALLRVSEVLHLRRDDLLGEDFLQRRLKGGKVRAIPVSRSLIATLRGYLKTPEQVYIFGDPPPKPRSVASLMTRAFRAAGLRGISHHVMRHTAVTDMLDSGISGKAIMELAGWTSMRMLQRYGHVRDAELQRATTGTAARNTAALAEAARQAEAQQDAAAQTDPVEEGGTKQGTR